MAKRNDELKGRSIDMFTDIEKFIHCVAKEQNEKDETGNYVLTTIIRGEEVKIRVHAENPIIPYDWIKRPSWVHPKVLTLSFEDEGLLFGALYYAL